MNCEEIQELLYDYIKNEVSVKEISRIEVHLKSCPGCSSELAHIKGISSLMRASMEEPHESVFLNIQRSIRPVAKKTIAWLKPAFAAVAAVVITFTSLIIYNRPYTADLAEIPDEIAAGYIVVAGDYYDELNEKGQAIEMASAPADETAAADEEDDPVINSTYYNSGYTPVNYILGR